MPESFIGFTSGPSLGLDGTSTLALPRNELKPRGRSPGVSSGQPSPGRESSAEPRARPRQRSPSPDEVHRGAQRSSDADAKEAEQILSVFKMWDTDGSGTISRAELARVMTRLMGNLSKRDIDALMEEADTNKNGLIEVEEFVRWLTKPAKTSVGKAIFDYHEALKPIWYCYDKDRTGSIDREQFEEVHCIMQGALRLFQSDSGALAAEDPLDLTEDSQYVFDHINKKKDRTIDYLEFIQWMKDHIPAKMPPEKLARFCSRLGKTIQETVLVVKKAEQGKIKEGDVHILENALRKLADTTRQFQDAMDGGHKQTEEMMKKAQPPLGLNIERLKGTHMKRFPVNFEMATSVQCEAYCFPVADMGSDPEKRDWIGRVMRQVQSGRQTKEEPPAFYRFEVASFSWVPVENAAQGWEDWNKAFQALDVDVALLCLMSSAANFGLTASWYAVTCAFNYAEEFGLIDAGKRKKYMNHIRQHFLNEAREDETAEEILSHLELKAEVVMGLISELGMF